MTKPKISRKSKPLKPYYVSKAARQFFDRATAIGAAAGMGVST